MNPISKLIKYLYLPICRVYVRRVLEEKPTDALMDFLCSLYFFHVHGYWPNLKKPRSFSEKLFWRMLNDHDPKLTMVSDKYCVRDYVAEKIGQEYLVPLLWQGNNPEDIPFHDLPLKYVIKANHGCMYNVIVSDSTEIDKQLIRLKLKKWLSENFCNKNGFGIAWAYKNIRPTIMIESFLDNDGRVPEDYKFFCFAGKAEYIQVSYDRFGDASERILTRDFKTTEIYNGQKLYTGEVIPPDNYKEMLQIADSLARGFDFIRVDLYSVRGKIYFGELTCYPAGGEAIFVPRKYDYVFGEKWNIRDIPIL